MTKYILPMMALLICSQYSWSQTASNKNDSKTAPESSVDDFETIKVDRLNRIYREMVTIRTQMNSLKTGLDSDLDMMARVSKESKLAQLEKEYDKKRFLFIETITAINLSDGNTFQKKSTFSEDIQQILEPALNTFKKVAEKPRQMQQYQEDLRSLKKRYENATIARQSLEKYIQENKMPIFKWKLKEALQTATSLEKQLKIQVEDLEFKLIKIEKNEQSIVTTFSFLIFDFIKTKGKNLLLALAVFLTFFWAFRVGQTRFIDLFLAKFRTSNRAESYHWVIRPVKVIYGVASTIVAFFMAILTLYVLNDWVLVTLILIMVAALIWSSKQYLPLFMEQTKIILNLGSVREGERVLYHGLPWKIDSLGYYCRLSNPGLAGAKLRVNTKELVNAHSRQSLSHEPWFPTKLGDWVMIGEIYGEVVLQSPEQVIVRQIGGQNHYFSAKDFYHLAPKNYSQGFPLEMILGVDYGHQKNVFSEVLPKFQQIPERLYKIYPELKPYTQDIKIDFLKAGASSLDIRFFMELSGEMASKKLMLERSVQTEYVKICNESGFTIPFNQLTVHMQHEK